MAFVSNVNRLLIGAASLLWAFAVQADPAKDATRDYVRNRSAAPVSGDLYALVVGINDYKHWSALDGAINDADDVADALRTRNAKRVWLLKDREASRDNIMAAWRELVATAKPGDFVLVHLAGHGARSPERIAKTGTDGLDEFFVLPDFQPDTKQNRERIVNKEWGALLRDASQFKIIFVADTCHSGSMTRGYSPRKLKTRVASPKPVMITNDSLPAPDPATWVVTPENLSHVAFFGAVGQDELDPEVLIDEKARGAMSWAVAKGLRGAADINHDGIVTMEELASFVSGQVAIQTDGEQHPRLHPPKIDISLPVGPSAATPAIPPAPAPLSLEILNTGRVPAAELAGGLRNVVLAKDGVAADLTWDVANGRLRSQLQDTLMFADGGPAPTAASEETRDYRRVPAVAARDGRDNLGQVQAAVDKRLLAQWLGILSATQPLVIALNPRDTLQHKGDRSRLSVSGNDYLFLTVVNIGPSGNINLVYPIAGDPLEIPKGRPYTLDLTADTPYGSEHFFAIASDKPLRAFHQGLASIDGKPQMDEFKKFVTAALSEAKVQIGIHAVFTSP